LAPSQRINRIWALKTATSWAAYSLFREDRLGTLEEGKFADFIILNKNYFDAKAVPDPMIKTVRPLLTMIGGHLRYIDTEFAAEQNTKPAGIQPEQVIKQIREWEAGGTGDKADAGREL